MTWSYCLISAGVLLLSCRARPDPSATTTEADSMSSFSGRVAVFDVYDQTTKYTRQVPGIMVSVRGALIPGLQPSETVVLADDQRRGERYFPMKAAGTAAVFVGLEAAAEPVAPATALTLAPARSLPPLSAQARLPLRRKSRINRETHVILYNDMGFVEARAYPHGDKIELGNIGLPRSYPRSGFLGALYNLFFAAAQNPQPALSLTDAEKMLRKGGAIIAADSDYEGIVKLGDGWALSLKGSKQTATVDILAFIDEDRRYEIYSSGKAPAFFRNDLLPEAVSSAVDSAAVKMKIPRELEQEILRFLNCKQ